MNGVGADRLTDLQCLRPLTRSLVFHIRVY